MFNSPLVPSSVGGPIESILLSPTVLGLVVLLLPVVLVGGGVATVMLRRLTTRIEVRQAWQTVASRARLLMLDLRGVR
jgi:hypothetical protein